MRTLLLIPGLAFELVCCDPLQGDAGASLHVCIERCIARATRAQDASRRIVSQGGGNSVASLQTTLHIALHIGIRAMVWVGLRLGSVLDQDWVKLG